MIILLEIYNQFLRPAGFKIFYISLKLQHLIILKKNVILPIAHYHGKQVLVKEEEFNAIEKKLDIVERVVSQVTGAPPYEALSEEDMFDLAFGFIKEKKIVKLMHDVEHTLWSQYVTASSFSST